MYGIEGLDHRVGRLSESLRIIKSLWTEERTNFDGRYYRMKDAIANPKPIQKPHPPIWIGASGETTMRLVARYADVWNTGTSEIDKGTEVITRLEDACGEVGREPSEIRHSIQFGWDGEDRSRLLEQSARYFELGFTELDAIGFDANFQFVAHDSVEARPAGGLGVGVVAGQEAGHLDRPLGGFNRGDQVGLALHA